MPNIVPIQPGSPAPVPLYNNARTVTNSAAENIPVPAGAKKVRLCSNAVAWAIADGTAAKPSDVSDGTSSFALQAGIAEWFSCDGIANISVISDGAGGATVGAAFYA